MSFRDGGGGLVMREDVVLRHAKVAKHTNELEIQATADGAIVEATCRGLELPDDWQEFGELRTTVRAGNEKTLIECSILGARNRMVQEKWLNPGEEHEFIFDLGDLPLAAGTRPPFHPTGMKLHIRWGDTWPSEGMWIAHNTHWPHTQNNQPVQVTWADLTFIREPTMTSV